LPRRGKDARDPWLPRRVSDRRPWEKRKNRRFGEDQATHKIR